METTEVKPHIHNPLAIVREIEDQKNAAQKLETQIFTYEGVKKLMAKVTALEEEVAHLKDVRETESRILMELSEDVKRMKARK